MRNLTIVLVAVAIVVSAAPQAEEKDFINVPEYEDPKIEFLKDKNFATKIESSPFAFVMFEIPGAHGHMKNADLMRQCRDELEKQQKGVSFFRMNVKENQKTKSAQDIHEYPTLAFFIGGKREPYTGKR